MPVYFQLSIIIEQILDESFDVTKNNNQVLLKDNSLNVHDVIIQFTDSAQISCLDTMISFIFDGFII